MPFLFDLFLRFCLRVSHLVLLRSCTCRCSKAIAFLLLLQAVEYRGRRNGGPLCKEPELSRALSSKPGLSYASAVLYFLACCQGIVSWSSVFLVHLTFSFLSLSLLKIVFKRLQTYGQEMRK